MKKQTLIIPFLLSISLVFLSACDNNHTQPGNPIPDQPVETSTDGFSDGHMLQGRYINTDNGIRSFTFKTDGTFTKGGAVSGEVRGGDYVAGTHDAGTYHLKGKTMQVTYENGETQELEIEIFTYNDQNDYSLATPARLKINHVMYTNVDE